MSNVILVRVSQVRRYDLRPNYDLRGRCSADAFPGSRAGRGSYNRDSLLRRPARPAAALAAAGWRDPCGITRAGVTLVAAVVASAAGQHGQERRGGQKEKCMSHVRCFLSSVCEARRSFVFGRRLDWVRHGRITQGLISSGLGHAIVGRGNFPARLRTLRINACEAGL